MSPAPRRAFVVEMDEQAGESRELGGRAEHVLTGEAFDFKSPQELIGFIRAVLANAPSKVLDADGWDADVKIRRAK